MSTPSDYSASVLARLLNHSRSHKENYQSLLIRYVIERFLYRLGQSEYKDSFVLKGAHLLTITFKNQTYRTTKDIDLLKSGDTQPEMIRDSLEAICSIPYPEDGVIFDKASIKMQDIREQNTYHGHRAKIDTFIGKARVVLQIDIGIGDSIFPGPVYTTIPTILDLQSSIVPSYPIETVIAEKLQAIIALSLLTSRMKDFYDLYIISMVFTLDYKTVKNAIRRTFKRRSTPIPKEAPVVFSEKVYNDDTKMRQWKAFVSKLRNEHSDLRFPDVIKRLQAFTEVFFGDDSTKLSSWTPEKGWS